MCGNTGTLGFARSPQGQPTLAKFYINFRYRDRVSTSDQGIDLPNLAEALDVATRSLMELVDETIKQGGGAMPDAMLVTDHDGKTLATISILDVLRNRRPDG